MFNTLRKSAPTGTVSNSLFAPSHQSCGLREGRIADAEEHIQEAIHMCELRRHLCYNELQLLNKISSTWPFTSVLFSLLQTSI